MSDTDKKIRRLLRVPGVLNWARQNFPRTDDTRRALQRLADAEIQISLAPIYKLCAELAHREKTFEQAMDHASGFEGEFYRKTSLEILPLFNDFISKNQFEALADFRHERVPFPIGRGDDNKVISIPVRPTFVTIKEGKLHPVFVLGWVNSPLSYYQRRLVSSVIRKSLLTQQDYLGSDAQILSFPRIKRGSERYQGGWFVSSFPDLSDEELQKQVEIYNVALRSIIKDLK